MLPPEKRLPEVRGLIEQQLYFVIHAPRQSGKTTCFRTLAETLVREGACAAVHASCETAQPCGGDVEFAVTAVCESIVRQAHRQLPEALRPGALDMSLSGASRLNELLRCWSERSPLPVVLFLDEIDALYDESLISVLRQLRDGYPDRPRQFPQSLALIGLRD
ncbi:MAG: ATP-binding protein, partial [Candidatus Schekmanbacteria bacterium]|nr:ATP-binding protein [Candidatus Schekmanbacteria bacterium]